MLLHEKITDVTLKCFFDVYNEIDYRFLEKVYENALAIEIRNAGLSCLQQFSIPVHFKDHVVGNYFANLFVPDKILIELKAAESICEEHELQILKLVYYSTLVKKHNSKEKYSATIINKSA